MSKIPESTPVQSQEADFTKFVKQSVGFVAAVVASVPVFADYLGVVPTPNGRPGKLLPMLTTVLSATVFLFFFWIKERLTNLRTGIVGLVSLGTGAITLLSMTTLPTDRFPALTVVLYVVGFVSSLGGVSLLFIFGYMRTQQRQDELTDLAPRMEPDEWEALKTFAGTLISIRVDISKRPIHPLSKKALIRSSENLVSEYNRMLNKLKQGTLEIKGPAMNEIFSYFMDGVQEKYRALSRDDLDYWESQEAAPYLDINRTLIVRGCEVERVFLIHRNKPLSTNHVNAIRQQIELGISARIGFLEDCQNLLTDDRDLDFGLFDTFAVSFWRFTPDRVFRISAAPEECQRCDLLFNRTINVCVSVPNKTGSERTIFKTPSELDSWLATSRMAAKA